MKSDTVNSPYNLADKVLVKVAGAQITVDANNDGVLNSSDDSIEANPALPGVIAQVNDDDDNADGTPDDQDTGAVTGENDLTEVDLGVIAPGMTGRVTLTEPSGASNVKIYGSADLSNEITSAGWDIGSQPSKVWVEAVSSSAAVADVALLLTVTPNGSAPTTSLAHLTAIDFDLNWTNAPQGVAPKVDGKITDHISVGQHMQVAVSNLKSAVSGTPTYKWTVDGNAISNWTSSLSSDSETALDGDKLTQSDISYYWIDGSFAGSPENLKAEVTIDGKKFSKTATFLVYRPNETVDFTRTIDLTANNSFLGTQANFTAHLNVPQGIQGSDGYIQTILDSDREEEIANGQWQETPVAPGLDSGQLNPSVFEEASNGPGTTSDYPNDSNSKAVGIYLKLKFETEYLFKPAGADSIYVPLRQITWEFAGESARPTVSDQMQLFGIGIEAHAISNLEATDYMHWNHNSGPDLGNAPVNVSAPMLPTGDW